MSARSFNLPKEFLKPQLVLLEEWKRPPQFKPPWGDIYKSDILTQYMSQDDLEIRKRFGIGGEVSSSLAIGKMEPGAFHSPYIRHASKTAEEEWRCKRVYKILDGSFSCVRDGKLEEHHPNSDYIVVNEDDIFSFKAGREGCVFAIFDFPAFEPGIDQNKVI